MRDSATAAAVVVALVLVTAPIDDGGRGALALLLHQTLLAVSWLWLGWAAPGWLRRGMPLLAGVGAFSLYAMVLSPYRYTSLLVVADVVAAAVLHRLAVRAAGEERAARLASAGLVAGAALVAGWGVIEALTGKPVRGLFTNPNHAASLVACAGGVLLGPATSVRAGPSRAWAARAGAAAALAFVVLAGSRGAALAFAVAAALVLCLRRRRRLLAALAGALILALLLPTPLARRVRGGMDVDSFAYARVGIWRAGLSMARNHVLRGGVGLGAFGKVWHRYNFPVEGRIARFGKVAGSAHCEYLALLAEASLPGLALIAIPLAVTARRSRRMLHAEGGRADLVTGAWAGVTVLLVQALVEANLHTPAVLYALAVLLALALPPESVEAPPAVAGAVRTHFPLLALIVAGMWWGGVWIPWLGYRAYERHLATGAPADLERAVRLVPGHAGYRERRASLAERDLQRTASLVDLDRARRFHEEAIALDPLDPAHVERLARLEHRTLLGAFPAIEIGERALAHYRAAIDLNPFNPFLEVNRALLLEQLGRRPEAIGAALRAARIEPNCRAAHALLGRLHELEGDPLAAAQARQELDRIDAIRRSLGDGGSPYERSLLAAEDAGPR